MTIEFDQPFLRALEEQRNAPSALAKRDRYLALLDPQAWERILDLGCGSGSFCRALVPLTVPA